jgi:hypothetical protein
MKKKQMVVVGLSILLSASSILTYAPRIDASEPGSLKTVTLRIEGMT